MSNKTKNNNHQKTNKNLLTDLALATNLKIAPKSQQADRRVSRQLKGGKVDTTQPPHVSGFFMPVNLNGNTTSLPGGYGIEKRSRVNTCGGVPLSHLETPGSFATATTQDNSNGTLAMKNANTHGTATPVAAIQGISPTCNECLLHPSLLSEAINQAKKDAASSGKSGRGHAYSDLLKHFHAAILPAFITETNGNASKMARLLGLHRETVHTYTHSIGLNHLVGRAGQEVQS